MLLFFLAQGSGMWFSWWFNMKDLHRICCRLCSITRFFNGLNHQLQHHLILEFNPAPSVPKVLHFGSETKFLQLRFIGLLQSPYSWLSYIPKKEMLGCTSLNICNGGIPIIDQKKAENRGESWSFHHWRDTSQFWRIHGTIVYLPTYYPKNSTKCIDTYNNIIITKYNTYTIHGSYGNRFCHPTIQLHIAPQMMEKHAVIRAGSLLCFGTFRKIPRDLGTRLFHTDTCWGWSQIPPK